MKTFLALLLVCFSSACALDPPGTGSVTDELIANRDDAIALCDLDSPVNLQAEDLIKDPTSTCVILNGGHTMTCSHGTMQCSSKDFTTPHCTCTPH